MSTCVLGVLARACTQSPEEGVRCLLSFLTQWQGRPMNQKLELAARLAASQSARPGRPPLSALCAGHTLSIPSFPRSAGIKLQSPRLRGRFS